MSDERDDKTWFRDKSIPQEEVDDMNKALEEAARKDPRWSNLIWERDPKKIN